MQWERPSSVFARTALTQDGWKENVLVRIEAGRIHRVYAESQPAPGSVHVDLLVPGMGNVHSHSFQRAMAGLTEVASGEGNDNFWSWRKVMYDFTHKLTPPQIEIISLNLYIDLLKQGYTGVGEFHYLHHQSDGRAYDSPTELSDCVIAAAADSGIHLTHLPVMYESANFGRVPTHKGQRRFIHTPEKYLELLETLHTRYGGTEMVLGVAPHSLRAVSPESLAMILNALPQMGLGECPVHIHVAEQEKEVEDCIAWNGQRPVEWLFDFWDVNKCWCLIHATHVNHDEIRRMGAWKAVAGLCPTTEANLGDGIFPAEFFFENQGRFGIGTDSQVCLSPWQELRQLEYAQRLLSRKRNVLCSDDMPSVGRTLFSGAAKGGAQALGIQSGQIAPGMRADLVGLSREDPLLGNKSGDRILDTLIFAGIRADVTDVLVHGNHVIADRRHALEDESKQAMRGVMHELRE